MVIMDTPESIGSLEEQALRRKQRLKNLKRKNPGSENTENDTASEIVPLPKPKFRSYNPQDESLKEAKLEDAEPVAVEEEIKDILEAGKEKSRSVPLRKDEVMHLLSLVESNPIVYRRTGTNSNINKLKDAAWVKITYYFNLAINSQPRKPGQLRLKWENLKKNARRRISNINLNNRKTGFGTPDYIPPDEILDKVATLLKDTNHTKDKTLMSAEEDEGELTTTVVIPCPSDDEEFTGVINKEITGDIDEEITFDDTNNEIDDGEAEGDPLCGTSGDDDVTNTVTEPKIDQRKRVFARRTSGKITRRNLLANELESRINRNNAIADYYKAKAKKINEEIALNREKMSIEKRKVELEVLELESKVSKVDKDKLLLKKKLIELELLELQRKKYSLT